MNSEEKEEIKVDEELLSGEIEMLLHHLLSEIESLKNKSIIDNVVYAEKFAKFNENIVALESAFKALKKDNNSNIANSLKSEKATIANVDSKDFASRDNKNQKKEITTDDVIKTFFDDTFKDMAKNLEKNLSNKIDSKFKGIENQRQNMILLSGTAMFISIAVAMLILLK